MSTCNKWQVNVKHKNEPGSSWSQVIINARGAHEAIQLAKAMYGPLLMHEIACPVYD
jgi:hypothetical protein